MSLQVEVISKEMMKPSFPTPNHLRHYNLSFLDQIAPSLNNSMVYIFKADDVANKLNIHEVSNLLKNSLSKILTHYFPLAGRLRADKLLVDCNDDGVPYIETKVRCQLNNVINNPSPGYVSKLLPYDCDEVTDNILGVQFNVFDCGGIAIGVCLTHKVADAMSYFQFINSWAAMTRGESDKIKTHFQSSSLFPPKKDMLSNKDNGSSTMDKVVCKRFLFKESNIESLRKKYSKNPTSRVAMISTFIWTRFMAATNKEEGTKTIIHFVGWTTNLRPRMDPPLPEYAFGNYYWSVRTFPTLDEQGECNNDLGGLLRDELNKIDKDFFVRVQEGNEWNSLQNAEDLARAISAREMDLFSFTSLCRFPVEGVDFGWGNPLLTIPTIWKVKNLVSLKDSKSNGGIEACVSLTEDDMAKFECDVELLDHVSTIG